VCMCVCVHVCVCVRARVCVRAVCMRRMQPWHGEHVCD
jgi:hypothetical protein